MEKGFILPNGSYVQAIDAAHLTAADYPDGTVEVPLKPGLYYEWDGLKWAYTPPAAPSIEQLRANASMSRAKFLQACVAEGVLEPSVAEEASSGVWPSAFDGFLTGLSVEQRIEAKATWVDGQRVRRDSPILALIAAEQGVTDEQLDTMFGVTGG